MKKKLTALLLCAALIVGCIPFASATTVDTDYIMDGEYVYRLKTDSDTSAAIPEDFGTKAADGKIWTDKSVAENGNGFDITLSALAQEYEVSNGNLDFGSTAVDVAMAIDLTGSMEYDFGEKTRSFEMIRALNEAMDIIMKANDKNRVIIYGFRDGQAPAILSKLGHYTNEKWNNEASWAVTGSNNSYISGKYFDYNYSSDCDSSVMSTSPDLLCDGAAYATTTSAIDGGTDTQLGIYTAAEAMISEISKDTDKSQERVPYFLLFTDGDPSYSCNKWYDLSSYKQNNSNTTLVAAQTILTAAYEKDKITAAYDTFNGKHIEDTVWFNIGVVEENEKSGAIEALLNPVTVKNGTNSKSSTIIGYFTTYTTKDYSAYSAYANPEKYVYAEEFVYYASAKAELDIAFTALANKIADRSKAVAIPVINHTATGSDSLSNFIITDKIGKGTEFDASTLKLVPAIAPDTPVTAVQNSSEGGTTVYGFTGFETTVTVTGNANDGQTVTASIPPEEIGLFVESSTADVYTASAPVRIQYSVKPTALNGSKVYSNESATASYYIVNDDPYYYDITKDALGNFTGSTLKSAFSSGYTEAKAANITGTATYVTSSTFVDGAVTDACKVTTQLGNNGLIEPTLKITKTSDNTTGKAQPGDEITFKVKVENLTKEAVEDIKIADPIPENTTPVKNSETTTDGTNSTINIGNDNNVYIVIDRVPAEQTTEFTYKVTIPDTAEEGDEIVPKTPGVTEVGGDEEIPGSDPADDESLKIEIENANEYSVIYSWTGAPTEATLPTDSGTYKKGANYTVDTTYTSASVINTYDAYGNVNGKYTFSGWTDPNSGVMGTADVTVTGEWKFENVTVTTHSITYSWSGDVPTAAVLTNNSLATTVPTDSNTYVKNQPFTVDTTFTSATIANVYDSYNNVTGYYEFSGWDTASGDMGDSDLEIKGTWTYQDDAPSGYSISYSWSGTIPEGVTCPTDSAEYVNGQPYTIDTTYTSSSTVLKQLDEDDGKKYDYSFSGWDKSDGTINNAGVSVTGVWSRVESANHEATYEWKTDKGPDKDKIVSGSLPDAPEKEKVYEGDNIPDPKTEEFTVITEEDDGNGGKNRFKFTFKKWNIPEEPMGKEPVTVYPEWKIEQVKPFALTYEFEGDAPAGVSAPKDTTKYYEGNTVTLATLPQTTIVDSDKNTWTFLGWGKNSVTFADSDITVKGSWHKEAPKEVKYKEPVEGGAPEVPAKAPTVPYGTKIQVNPNTGSWKYEEQTYATTQTLTINEDTEIPDPEKTNSVFMGWEVITTGLEDGIAYQLKAIWEDDSKGPNGGSDGVPDKFQRTVIFNIENGVWEKDTDLSDPDVNVVTLLKNDKWSEEGTASVDVPTGMTADYGYTDGKWDEELDSTVTVDNTFPEPTVYTYSFTKIGNKEVKYKEPVEGGAPEVPEEVPTVPYGTKVQVDPDTGTWTHKGVPYSSTQTLTIEEDTVIEDPVKTDNVFMGWEIITTGLDDGIDYKLKAKWEEDKKGPDGTSDKVPDKYQVDVKFNVVNGSWDEAGAKTDPLETVITLTKEGKWSEQGEGKVRAPETAYPSEGYKECSWDNGVDFGDIITLTKDGTKEFTLTYAKDSRNINYYTEKTADGYEKPEEPVKIEYGSTLTVELKGGSYDSTPEGWTAADPQPENNNTYSKVVKADTEVFDAFIPKRENYVFNGWDCNKDKDGNVTLTAKWENDSKGQGSKSDGIPDKFQKTVIFKVENGVWVKSPEDKADKTNVVTLLKDGKWSEEGTASVTVPAGMEANYGYTGGDWDADLDSSVTVDKTFSEPTVYTYSFTKIGDKEVKYKEPVEGDEPEVPAEVPTVPYGTKIQVNPNTGTWTHKDVPYSSTQTLTIEEDTEIPDPVKADNVFMGWEVIKTGLDDGIAYQLKAKWETDTIGPDGKSDGVPDKFQRTIIFKVINGVWVKSPEDKADKTNVVTLVKEGKWSEEGTASVTVPAGMEADYGYENGVWNAEIGASVTVDKTFTNPTVYAYSFSKIGEKKVKYNEPKPGELPGLPEEIPAVPYGTKIQVNPNTGLWENGGKTYDDIQTLTIEEDTDISDPVKAGNVFMGWNVVKTGLDGDIAYQLKADWEKDEIGPDGKSDGIPDKFQKKITFSISHGRWASGNSNDIIMVVTLRDESGHYSETGFATVTAPTGMIPFDNHGNGVWVPEVPEKVSGAAPESFTYAFEKVKAKCSAGILIPIIAVGVPVAIGTSMLAATVAASIGIPLAILATKHIVKEIKAIKDSNEPSTSDTDVDIPDTGSNDMMSATFSAIIALAGGIAVLAMTKKKKHDDK